MISVDVEGLAEIAKALRRLERRLPRALSKAVHGAATKERARAIERIKSTKVDPQGQPWAPWSDSYAATRKAHHSLLIDERELLRSFWLSGVVEQSGPGGTVFAETVSNLAEHAGWLDEGTPGMPAREFLGVTPDAKKELEQAVMEQLDDLLGAL